MTITLLRAAQGSPGGKKKRKERMFEVPPLRCAKKPHHGTSKQQKKVKQSAKEQMPSSRVVQLGCPSGLHCSPPMHFYDFIGFIAREQEEEEKQTKKQKKTNEAITKGQKKQNDAHHGWFKNSATPHLGPHLPRHSGIGFAAGGPPWIMLS